jgi:hypothetical protein
VKRFFFSFLALTFLLFPVSPVLPEGSSGQIVMYHLKDGGIKEISDHFSPSEKIYAEFTFLPGGKETAVEFRWINPQNKKEQAYFELVKSPMPPKEKTILCWLLLQPSPLAKIIGTRFFGRWRLEIWVDSHRVAEKVFDIGN